LLDLCVKNCGFPFHLQIATKEFLNELVKRFPEHPPSLPTPRQLRILEFIHAWQLTIASDPKFKNEFQCISKMHRLLSSKGYRFPGIDHEITNVMVPTETLRSAMEIEEEDLIIKKAKLQELLRKGGPSELAEANVLMKELSGYEPNVNYKQLEQTNIENIQSKALHLEALLHTCTTPYELQLGELPSLYQLCMSSQSKIAALVQNKDEDDNLDPILQLNDNLNRVIQLYHQKERGFLHPPPPTSSSPPPSSTTTTTTTTATTSSSSSTHFGDLISLDPILTIAPHQRKVLYSTATWQVSLSWTPFPPSTVTCHLQNLLPSSMLDGPWTVTFGSYFSGRVDRLDPFETKTVTFQVPRLSKFSYQLIHPQSSHQGHCMLSESDPLETMNGHKEEKEGHVGGGREGRAAAVGMSIYENQLFI
ncbi:hypothetical protein HMI54_009335, partial [Coelomomyces lativittatus]